MSTLTVSQELLNEINRHGESTFPHECCGFMFGTQTADARQVTQLWTADNERTENAERRFLISPQEFMKAEREALRAGVDMIGIYHSHPDHPAKPSEFDREHAWPNYSYVIVSVMKGQADRLTSWRLREDRSTFDEETIITTDQEIDS